MTEAHLYLETVASRVREFLNPAVQWQRGLWNTGTVLALREVAEASDGALQGAISVKAVKWLANETRGQIKHDPGVGSSQERDALDQLLTKDLTAGGVRYRKLVRFTDDLSDRYLDRWADATSGGDKPSREVASRALATHLLDSGFSREFLTSWLQSVDVSQGESPFRAGAELVRSPKKRFELALLVVKPPPEKVSRPTEWKSAQELSKWLNRAGFSGVRQHGGLICHVQARDAHSAAAEAADIADRLRARAAVGMRHSVTFLPHAYIAGHASPISLSRSRRAEVRALERQGVLFDREKSGHVDAALELLSHLNGAPAPVAVAGGWSAIESLLAGPGDTERASTADRLGALVACSWPRAELTTLAWAWIHSGEGDLREELIGFNTNRSRSQRLLDAIESDNAPEWSDVCDDLACRRVQKLIRDPGKMLKAIRRVATGSLRRLYRQRNLVLHGGRVRSQSLDATLRTVSPLVGAGLDRIAHADLVGTTEPLDLVARCQFEIDRAGAVDAPSLVDLLE